MKNTFITRINNYLIAHYPSIWNTRLVWMLLISLGIHILFFIAGYLNFSNPASLHWQLYDSSVVSQNGAMLFAIAASIILIVLWLVFLFKNNAFKNFYPSSRKKIFLSFIYYFIILFASTTFHISFIAGYKTFINHKYPAHLIKEQRLKVAQASPFLLLNVEDYDLSRRGYPSPFDTLERETFYNTESLYKGPAIYSNGKYVQFFRSKVVPIRKDDTSAYAKMLIAKSVSNNEINKDTILLKLIDSVYDLSAIADTGLTIFNYSDNYFYRDLYLGDYQSDTSWYNSLENIKFTLLKETHHLLQTRDEAGIKTRMKELLEIANQYKVKNNLTVDKWFKLAYTPPRFRVDSFISTYEYVEQPDYEDTYAATAIGETTQDAASALSEKMNTFFKARTTKSYIEINTLKMSFDNLDSLRIWQTLKDYSYFTMWLSFGLASILLTFRTTELKSVIFSAVTAGLLGICVALFVLLTQLQRSTFEELSIPYFILFISLLILIIPIVGGKSLSKKIRAIFMNITIVFMVPFGLLILAIIDIHQRRYFTKTYGYDYNTEVHHTIMENLGEGAHWLLLAFGLLFLYGYAQYIKRWKALEEA